MSDVIFIGATIVFFAICALYVHWCDKIIGPDDFRSATDPAAPTSDDVVPIAAIDVIASSTGVTP